jgi:sterol desaturase/sphingolipid hydroxylase (fatty acid hydroxylase superfamily)
MTDLVSQHLSAAIPGRLPAGRALRFADVSEADFRILRLAGFAAAAALALGIERLRPHRRWRPSLRTNGTLWLVDAALLGAACGACACAVALWAEEAGVGLLNVAHAPGWAGFAATIAALDLVSYGWHRANHRIGVLWRFHRVHHADRTFTATTALRFHPGELLLSLPVRLAAIIALGAPAAAVVAFEVVFTFANLFEHGDIDLPPRLEQALARVVVTPAPHRRHHSLGLTDRDRNFGTVLSAWDRLGGTYRESSSRDRIDVGLAEAGASASDGPIAALLLPFRRLVA